MALPVIAAAFMAGLAAREWLAADQTMDDLRRHMRQLNPAQQAMIEELIARGLDVAIRQGKEHLTLYVRDKAGRIRERILTPGGPDAG